MSVQSWACNRAKQQLLRIAAWASQTVNVWLLLGHHDQTVSARCWMNRYRPGWRVGYRLINAVFFWQENHCRSSYKRDVEFARDVLGVEM